MTFRSNTCSMLITGIGITMFACTPVVIEEVDQAAIVTYKIVESGTLEVRTKGELSSTEEYTIEAGSDGNWVAGAKVTTASDTTTTRDVRMEMDSTFKPLMYTEETTGATPLRVFVSFQPDKAVFNYKQGDNPQQSKTVEGAYELFADPMLFHHHAILARAYLSKKTTDKLEMAMVGGDKLIVQELEPAALNIGGKQVKVRHLRMVLAQGRFNEHVWLRGDDLQLLKIKVRGGITATRVDIPEAEQLGVRKKKGKKKAVVKGASDDNGGSAPGDSGEKKDDGN